MKFLDTLVKLKAFFNLFKKSGSTPSDERPSGKGKRVVLILSLIVTGIDLVVAVALLVRKLKQRRLEKEAEEALEEYYSTDFDADEYADDEETDE